MLLIRTPNLFRSAGVNSILSGVFGRSLGWEQIMLHTLFAASRLVSVS